METKTITVTNKHLKQAQEECQAEAGYRSKHCLVTVALRDYFDSSLLEVGTTAVYVDGWPSIHNTWRLDATGQDLVRQFDEQWRLSGHKLEEDVTFQISKG